jgi:hypothetical protein
MTKKLDTASITNELAQTAFFRQNSQPVQRQDRPSPLPENPVRQEEQPNGNIIDRATRRPTDRMTGCPARGYWFAGGLNGGKINSVP